MKDNRIVIGIAGDSATGKSVLAELIKTILGNGDSSLIDGDSYHKWERNDEHWKKYTHLAPEANFLDKQMEDVKNLKNGNKVHCVEYDHSSGTFTEQKILEPKKFIIVNGLHTLYLKEMRENLTFKIYMDANKTLKSFWKINRDSSCRNQSINEILNNIKNRECDYKKYILTQSKYADLVIMYFDKNLKTEDLYNNIEPSTSLEIAINSAIDIKELIYILKKYNINSNWKLADNLKKHILSFNYENFKDIEIPFTEIIYQLTHYRLKSNVENINNLEKIELIVFIYALRKKLCNTVVQEENIC